MLIHGLTDYDPGDLFFLWLCIGCGWVGGFLQYRFPVGGARTASRSRRRAAALGPNYKLGQTFMAAGVALGGLTTILSILLENSPLGEMASVVVFAFGTLAAAGAVAYGRRLKQAAEKTAAAQETG